MNEHEIEPVPGLPDNLPQGEHILWQGAPSWQDLAIRAFHVRGVAIYFAALFGYLGWSAHVDGQPDPAVALVALKPVPIAALLIGALLLLAYAVSRTTLYTITNKRIVMRFGLALPMTVNLPYAQIKSADLSNRDGTGDIAVDLNGDRQSLVVLWPHVRPWRTTKPQPMLRSIPDVALAADVLSAALGAFHGASSVKVPRKQPAAASPLPSPHPAAA